jgi:hypothetical protein
VPEHQAPVTDDRMPAPEPPKRRGFVDRASGKAVRRVAIYLDAKTYEALKRYCGEQHAMSDVGAEAVREFLAARGPARR